MGGPVLQRMSITVEVEFGNMDCSDHICAYQVSFSVRKSQGYEKKVAIVGQGWQLPHAPTPFCNMSEQSLCCLRILNANLIL